MKRKQMRNSGNNILNMQRYRYHERTFATLLGMIKTLFVEIEKQLELLENGEIKNIRMNRREISWKLLSIRLFEKEKEFRRYRKAYNKYWSRLYYLEHASGEEHPYLKELRQKLMEQSRGS